MPIVNGKHFSYTKEGKAMAKKAKSMMKKKMMTSDGHMPLKKK